jgi:hypothetical protein
VTIECYQEAKQLSECSFQKVEKCQHVSKLDCAMNNVVPQRNFTATPLRLSDGFRREGRLEILKNNRWGSICDEGFNDEVLRI